MARGRFFIPPVLLMLKMTSFSALLFLTLSLSAQTNISGVVNTYYQVVEVIPAKACVRLNTTVGLNQNDRALLIQMKGASIDVSSNTSSAFGDTISLNNAGNYELGTICYIRNDSVFFVYLHLNNYTATGGKVQLVRVPEYISATVTDTLKAAPWDNTTGTGGVVAIYVQNDLVLNAPISADSAGYRGGIYRLSGSSCTNFGGGASAYAYNPTSSTQNGAYKGEGVADIASINQQGGRGAPANGGGGGNNHNNGGAGGANLTVGGDGGGNSSSTGCTLAIQGKGGKALSSYGGTKIFMGGGGGAGHTNNGAATGKGGGHGGGIVFIRTDNLVGNSQKISANGQQGGPAASDGAGGGGAGGTIIMSVNNYLGTLSIQANGGQGGTEDDGLNLQRCYGPGGGGSGGVAYFSGALPSPPVTTTATAGPAGLIINHDGSCNPAVPGLPGAAGQTITSYTYRESLVLTNNYCSELLPVQLLWFNAQYVNKQAILKWRVADPDAIDRFSIERSTNASGWYNLGEPAANSSLFVYQDVDPSPLPGPNYYRIKVIKKSGAVIYSSIQKITAPGRGEFIHIYPNPASQKIFITGLASPVPLSLYDISGKMIWQKKTLATNNGNAEVDLPRLSTGIYVIRVGEKIDRLIIR